MYRTDDSRLCFRKWWGPFFKKAPTYTSPSNQNLTERLCEGVLFAVRVCKRNIVKNTIFQGCIHPMGLRALLSVKCVFPCPHLPSELAHTFVCERYFFPNKSTSYLSLCLSLNSFCHERVHGLKSQSEMKSFSSTSQAPGK